MVLQWNGPGNNKMSWEPYHLCDCSKLIRYSSVKTPLKGFFVFIFFEFFAGGSMTIIQSRVTVVFTSTRLFEWLFDERRPCDPRAVTPQPDYWLWVNMKYKNGNNLVILTCCDRVPWTHRAAYTWESIGRILLYLQLCWPTVFRLNFIAHHWIIIHTRLQKKKNCFSTTVVSRSVLTNIVSESNTCRNVFQIIASTSSMKRSRKCVPKYDSIGRSIYLLWVKIIW